MLMIIYIFFHHLVWINNKMKTLIYVFQKDYLVIFNNTSLNYLRTNEGVWKRPRFSWRDENFSQNSEYNELINPDYPESSVIILNNLDKSQLKDQRVGFFSDEVDAATSLSSFLVRTISCYQDTLLDETLRYFTFSYEVMERINVL